MTDDRDPERPGPSAHSAPLDPAAFARAVGALVAEPDPPVDPLAAVLDGWAAGDDDGLAVVAVVTYAEVARVRPEWLADEVRKLTAARGHPSEVVRAAAASALESIGAPDG